MPYNDTYNSDILHFTIEPIDLNHHKEIYDNIVGEFYSHSFSYGGGRNILLDLENPVYKNFCNQLYDIFKDLAVANYKVNISKDSSTNCWANLSNTNFFIGNIHNHKNTADINCVYYFNVPENCGGEIDFFDEENQIVFTFTPKNGDMLIFPGSLNHKNRYINSEDFRISINMEILIQGE